MEPRHHLQHVHVYVMIILKWIWKN